MTNVLLVLTMPEPIRNRYRDAMASVSPQLKVNVADRHESVDPWIGEADILVTFGPMMSDHVFQKAKRLQWVQALGSGVESDLQRFGQVLDRDDVSAKAHAAEDHHLLLDRFAEDS